MSVRLEQIPTGTAYSACDMHDTPQKALDTSRSKVRPAADIMSFTYLSSLIVSPRL